MESALAALDAVPGVRVIARSALHETAPVGGVAKHRFVNACAIVETTLSPQKLLAELLAVETAHGRTREVRFADRTLDLDLLFYDDRILNDPACTVPHPEMHKREFVLAPLAEIAPEWVHPGLRKSVAALYEEVVTARTG